jgi:hypothetical protein
MSQKLNNVSYYQKNKNDLSFKKKLSEYNQYYHEKYPEARLHRIAKHRAKKTNKEFNLSRKDIIVPYICPVLNVPLIHNTPHAPSLDRINNNRGYLKDNIMVISRRANLMKNDASPEELVSFAKWILKTYGDPDEEVLDFIEDQNRS